MNKHKFNHLLVIASTMSLVAGSQAVYAQQATSESAESGQVEEIMVTGFRASLRNSMEIKRSSDSIMEAVSSEDIGKLPDKSIADSLMRLPGLATQRLNGRAQVISIRGFAPDYSETLLNGRQQASTNGGRRIEYDQYPAEFTSAAVVYKSPDAAIIGQGIAGTIDLQTIRPLKYGQQTIQVSARYEENDREPLNSDATNKGNRVTLSYIDQFNDDTFGLALALSHTDTPTQGEKFNAWGYPQINEADPASPRVIGGVKPFVQSSTLERDSIIGTLEFSPSDTFSSSVDFFYSKFEEEQLLRGMELPLQWSSAQLQPGYIARDGVVANGTFANVQGVIRSDATLTDVTLYSVGWNTKFAIGDTWQGDVDLNLSSADRDDEVLENYSGYIDGPDTLSFNTTTKGTKFTSSLDYTDASRIRITNLQGWGGDFVPSQIGYDSLPHMDEELNQIKLSASRDLELGPINRIQIGVAGDTRKKTIDGREQYYFGPHLDENGDPIFSPLPSKTSLTDLSFVGLGSIITYDPLLPKKEGLYNVVRATRADVLASITSIEEDVTTLFIKAGIDTELLVPIKGNVGVQVVSTDQRSDGSSTSGNQNTLVVVDQSGGDTYTNVLPTMNLTFSVTDQDAVKLALARTLSRPNMGAMTASSQFSFSTIANEIDEISIETSPWSASGGNPRLRPWMADSADISYEHYFDDSLGYWSLASFYKDLKSYVFNDTTLMDFSDFPAPAGQTPKMYEGTNTVPTNGSGGYVRGLEFTVSITGEMFSDYLSGFGAVYTTSFTESNIQPANTVSNRLPGLSERVRGLQLYYEQNGWNVRVSENYRSDFLGDFTSNIGTPEQRIINETTLLDAQIGYTFEEGTLDGFSVTLQGYNLNDEPTVSTVDGDQLRVIDYQSYGRSYALNLTYKY